MCSMQVKQVRLGRPFEWQWVQHSPPTMLQGIGGYGGGGVLLVLAVGVAVPAGACDLERF